MRYVFEETGVREAFAHRFSRIRGGLAVLPPPLAGGGV